MIRKKMYTTLICVFVLFSSFCRADTIRIGADEWCPYNCKPGSKKPGYAIEVVRSIFEKAGHKVNYQTLPWNRAILWCREGKIDAIVGASKDEVPDFIFPKECIGISNVHFFVKKGNPWRYQGIASLNQVTIGIMDSYAYGEVLDVYFKAYKNTNNVQVISSIKPLYNNIKKLLVGRIDVIPEEKAVFLSVASDMGVSDQVVEAGMLPVRDIKELEELEIYLAFSPNNPKSIQYSTILSQGINTMRASGELSKLLNKYGLNDWSNELRKIRERLNSNGVHNLR